MEPMRLQYTSALELPRVTADAVASWTSPGVYVEPPGENRHFTRRAPCFIDDPGMTGLFAGLGRQIYSSPPAFLGVLPNAMLFGYRELAWSGQFCTDEAWSDPLLEDRFLRTLASSDPFLNEDTGLVATQDTKVFKLYLENRPTRHFSETVVVLCSHEPSNYGSFLFRVLPKLHAIGQLGLDGLRIVVWAHTPSFLGLLALAGVPESRIIQHDTHVLTTFNRVISPSLRNPHGFLDAESQRFFQQLAAQAPKTGYGRRLYVSRQGQARSGASSRRMINESAVIEAVLRLGFEVIEPESLSPVDQMSAFGSADFVVGPAGSAMFNIVFCRPGTKVIDIESEGHWIYAHTGLFASCQTEYGLFVGEVDQSDASLVHRRFSVNVPALVARIESFLRD